MFRFTIATTNHPTRIRFVSNQPLGVEEIDFTNVDDAGSFPLIKQLFYLPFLKMSTIQIFKILIFTVFHDFSYEKSWGKKLVGGLKNF